MYNKTHVIVEEVHGVEFDEVNGSQVDKKNIDDVIGDKLEKSNKVHGTWRYKA